MAEQDSIVCINHIFFTHSFTDEYLGWFYSLDIVSGVEMTSVCLNWDTEP